MKKLLPTILSLALVTSSALRADEGKDGAEKPAGALSAKQIFDQKQSGVVLVQNVNERGETVATGTGFFVREDTVATDLHVVRGGKLIRVKVAESETIDVARISGIDVLNDLICLVLQHKPASRPAISNDFGTPEVGSRIIVIGNPLGLERTISDGLVSGVRDLGDRGKTLQITAPVSPGSSGSPIFDLNEKVIGVVQASLEAGQELNFATPSSALQELLAQNREFEVSQLGSEIANAEYNLLRPIIDAASDAYVKGDYQKAIAECDKGLLLVPERRDLTRWKASSLLSTSQLDALERFLLKHLQEDPGDFSSYYLLGKGYLVSERYQESAAIFHKGLSLIDYKSGRYWDPAGPLMVNAPLADYFDAYGLSLLSGSRDGQPGAPFTSAAADAFLTALAIDHKNPQVWADLSRTLDMKSDDRSAHRILALQILKTGLQSEKRFGNWFDVETIFDFILFQKEKRRKPNLNENDSYVSKLSAMFPIAAYTADARTLFEQELDNDSNKDAFDSTARALCRLANRLNVYPQMPKGEQDGELKFTNAAQETLEVDCFNLLTDENFELRLSPSEERVVARLNCGFYLIRFRPLDQAYGPQNPVFYRLAFVNGSSDLWLTSSRSQHPIDHVILGSADAGLAYATPVPSSTPLLVSDEQATAAFNFLQDRLEKPHVKRVWYDPGTDSYTWIGPKFGKKMSMPRSQFDAEIWPDYVKAYPTEQR